MTENQNKSDGQYPYIKLFPEEYLGGSLHFANTLEERGFFVDLMCLAGKNRKERGTLSLEKGVPMSMQMIANALFIDLETCNRLMEVMLKQERVTRREDGVLLVTKFDYYQKYYRTSKKTEKPLIPQEALDKMTVRNAVKNPQLAHRAEQINGNQVISPQGEILNSPVDQPTKEFGEVCTIYSDNIDKKLSSMIADELQIIYDESGLEWFREAVKIACVANVRKLSYVQGILKDWHTNGYKNEKGNHHKTEPINSDIGGVNPKKFETQKYNNLVQR